MRNRCNYMHVSTCLLVSLELDTFFCSHVTMRGREPVGSSILASNANVFTLARKKATMKKEQ